MGRINFNRIKSAMYVFDKNMTRKESRPQHESETKNVVCLSTVIKEKKLSEARAAVRKAAKNLNW